MRSKWAVIGTCAAVVLVFAFTQFVHGGYVGVIESGKALKVLGRGVHFRPPWTKVAFYPVMSREVAIGSAFEGSRGKCKFDLSLYLSVSPDSVAPLHRAYHGRYVERAITPLVEDFLLRRGTGSGGWDPESEKVAKDLAACVNTALNPAGVFIHSAEIRSFEVETDLEGTIR
jgi:hypothetical protein